MGRFSTSAQYFLEPTGTLDDQSGKFEIGYTVASKKFLQELQETYIYPVWETIKAGQDPILKLLHSPDCTDEQLFKTMAMFWQFERSVGALHGTWLLGYTFGSKGEYQEVEYLEIRQIYDEYKHARMYEDAMLQLGYVDARRELFTHPWAQFSPEALGLHTFLQRLGTYPIAVRAAGNHLASEAPLIPWFEAAGRGIKQPLVAGTFAAQTIEETEHMKIGEYVVLKYGQTSEVQALARWACHMVNTLTMRFLDSFAKSLEIREEHMLGPVAHARAAAPEASANGHSIGPVEVVAPTEPVAGFVMPASLV
jgi:hypothetical protein